MKKSRAYLLKLILLCVPLFSYSHLPQGDTPYFQSSVTKKLNIIASESYKKDFSFIHQYSQKFHEEYSLLFKDLPYNKSFLVFISPRKQLLNGHSVIDPFPLIYIYSNIDDAINQVASHNWLQDSIAHELVHLYQLNSQGTISRYLRWVFPPLSWFVYPNIYTHRLLLEGNAILLESIYGTGGRLFSGWVRAFVFSQLKNQISLKRILNNYNDLFSTEEKYFHGGYFFNFLLENYSLSKINDLFFHHRDHIVFPSEFQSINWAFYKTFEESFESLFKKYKKFYLQEAKRQKKEIAPTLFKSGESAPLNSDKEHIYFMTSDGKTPPSLITLNKKTEAFSSKKQDMPVGKVFVVDNFFYSAGTGHTSTLVSETSLFKNGYIPLKQYNSRYVMDIKKNKVISFDTGKGPNGFPLLVNDSFYDFIHSTAIMNSEGHVYYFKQEREVRTLYKDKIPLWSFKGYYSFPIEVDKETVYFIGPTEYGSGLFSYTEGKVFRLSPSDTIVAARKIRKNRFLVTEVGPSHYEYKIINTNPIPKKPVLYRYSFKKKHDFLNDLTEKNFELHPSASLKANTKEKDNKNPYKDQPFQRYNPLTNLKFHDILFIPFIRLSRPFFHSAYLQTRWTDPLQQNLLVLFGSFGNKSKAGGGKYIYKKSRLQWELSHQFTNNPFTYIENKPEAHIADAVNLNAERFYSLNPEGLLWESPSFLLSSYKFSKTQIAFKYPFIKKEHWNISTITKWGFGKERFTPVLIKAKKKPNGKPVWRKENSREGNYDLYSTLFINQGSAIRLEYKEKYPEAFGKHKYLNISFYYDGSYLKKDKNYYLTLGSYISFEKEFGDQWYLSGSGRWNHNLKNPFLSRLFKPREEHTFWSYHNFMMPLKAKKYRGATIILKKALNQSFYTLRFPVALKRWAPLAGVSLISLSIDTDSSKRSPFYSLSGEKASSNPLFASLFIGGEAEFSFNYNVDISAGLSLGPVFELENLKKKYNHGFHIGTYLKTVF